MFLKLSFVIISVLTMANSATAATPPINPQAFPQCCNAVLPLSANAVAAVSNLLQIELNVIPNSVGLVCRPFVPSSTCLGTTLRCGPPDIEWGGLIAFNCVQASF